MDNFNLKKYLTEGKLYEEAYNLPDSDSNTDRYVDNHWGSILKDILRAHTDLRNSKGGEGMPERPSQLDIDIVLGRFDGADEFMDVDPSVYDGDYFDFYDMYLVTQRDEENTKDISVEDYPEGDYSGYTKRDDLPNLAEGKLNENASGKVLVDKVEPRWIIADPSNINMKGVSGGPNSKITYYKRESSAQKELDEKIKNTKVTGVNTFSDEYKNSIASAEVIEVEMQIKITVK